MEATLADAELANRLASEVMGQSLDALLPQTRQLLLLIHDHIGRRAKNEQKQRSQIRFTQRQLREAFGWSDFQIRKHLARLVELEYVVVHRTGHGNQRQYELLYDGQGRDGQKFVLGLVDIEKLTNTPSAVRNEHLSKESEPPASPDRAASESPSSRAKTGATNRTTRKLRSSGGKRTSKKAKPPKT